MTVLERGVLMAGALLYVVDALERLGPLNVLAIVALGVLASVMGGVTEKWWTCPRCWGEDVEKRDKAA